MGGCQNYGLFLDAPNTKCLSITGIQKRDYNFDSHPYNNEFARLSKAVASA